MSASPTAEPKAKHGRLSKARNACRAGRNWPIIRMCGRWCLIIPMFGGFQSIRDPRFSATGWKCLSSARIRTNHLGDVYLNGVSFFESTTLEGVYDPQPRDTDEDFALKIPCPVPDVDRTRYVWHAEVDENAGTTTIWANFQGADPNEELVEVSVRRTCFFPSRNHVNLHHPCVALKWRRPLEIGPPPTSQQWGHDRPELVVWLDHRRQRAA